MKYIIPVYVYNEINNPEDLKVFESSLLSFVKHAMDIPNMFELHEDKDSVRHEVYDKGMLRRCTTKPELCYPVAIITNYDFNSEIGTYFLEVDADENFKSSGVFYPRLLVSNPLDKKHMRITGLDYIVKGMGTNDNKN